MIRGKAKEFVLDIDGILRIGGLIFMPIVGDLVRLILEEGHCSRYGCSEDIS